QVALQTSGTDQYGRLLSIVLVDGRDANLEQLRAGLAWFYREYEDELDAVTQSLYRAGEAQASIAGVGLWSEPDPLPPWDYRRRPAGSKSGEAPAESAPAGGDVIIGNRNSKVY